MESQLNQRPVATGNTQSRTYIGIVLVLGLLASCGGSNSGAPPAPTQRGALVSVTGSSTFNVGIVNAAIAALTSFGVDTSVLSGTYGVSLNRIVYKTLTPDGRLINASGVVAYPLKTGVASSPILSFQHATMFRDVEAPSLSPDVDVVLMAAAGTGFIVAMPDYTGYAASTSELHTYVHAAGLADAVVDMLRATRQFLSQQSVATNGQLFLTGYSEGGYATLAAQKKMEQYLPTEFPITASMPAAGPYDMSTTVQYIVGLATNDNPAIAGFVFKAYDHWYGWNRLGDIFQSPYATVIDTHYDGNYSAGEITTALTTNSAALFTTTFRSNFLGSGESAVKAGFAANDIYHWAPVAPTRLFHGVDDTIVPYFNATTAVSAMTTAGSTSVTLVDCTTPTALIPRDHENCVPNYLSRMLNWFVGAANNL
jgi:dienelactone hydrolase